MKIQKTEVAVPKLVKRGSQYCVRIIFYVTWPRVINHNKLPKTGQITKISDALYGITSPDAKIDQCA